MKPLAARACARPFTAPSTMTLLEQPNRARCAINCRIHRSLVERARSRSSAGYRPATLPLDSLVGSLAARPIASLRWRKTDSNHRSRVIGPSFRPVRGVHRRGHRAARRQQYRGAVRGAVLRSRVRMTCMGLFLSSSRFGLLPFFVRSGKAVLRPVACDQVRGACGRGQGTETLAKA